MATAKKRNAAQKDVYTFVNDRTIAQLETGNVPWRKQWTKGGIPTNLATRHPFRGLNVMLLAMLGYERNLFITERQLKKIDGAIKPEERPHMLVSWNVKTEDGEEKNGETTDAREYTGPRYYYAYNISQCAGISREMVPDVELLPIATCEEIIESMPHPPLVKYKDPKPYYDPTTDTVNMPKKSTFASEADYCSALLHQLVHSTGHHTRLRRSGLIEMPELGCDPFTLEELVAEIATCHLQSYAGILSDFVPSPEYLHGWAEKFAQDKYLIFTAATLAQKAVDFILNMPEPDYAPEAVDEPASVTT